LHSKVLIFLRNKHDCKAVDLYDTSKRHAVIDSFDLMRNLSLDVGYIPETIQSDRTRNTTRLASCCSKIKKPKWIFSLYLCLGNQSVIARVSHFDTIAASLRAVFNFFQ
jgi:hypothetical protein